MQNGALRLGALVLLVSAGCASEPPAPPHLCAQAPTEPPLVHESGACGAVAPALPSPACPAPDAYGAPWTDAPGALQHQNIAAFSADDPTGAYALFREGRFAEAATRFASLARQRAGQEAGLAARAMECVALFEGGAAAAADRCAALGSEWPLLGDYLTFLSGEALRRAGRLEEAVERLALVPDASPHGTRAALARARALRTLGRSAEAVQILREKLERAPAPDVQLLLAETLAARGERDEAARLLGALRELWPRSDLAQRAVQRLAELLGGIEPPPAPAGSRHARRLLDEGRRLYGLHRSERAISRLQTAARHLPQGSGPRCEAVYLVAKSYDKLRDRDAGIPFYEEAARECAGSPMLAEVLFFGGRSLFRQGRLDAALRFFDRLHREFPHETTNDDALIYEAHIHAEAARADDRAQALERILRDYPDGDMREEAAFLLVWDAWQSGDMPAVLAAAAQAEDAVPEERSYWARGRTQYWRGRALARLGRVDDATSAWRRVLANHPLSYYATLATARLCEVLGHERGLAEVRRATRHAGPGPGIGGGAIGGGVTVPTNSPRPGPGIGEGAIGGGATVPTNFPGPGPGIGGGAIGGGVTVPTNSAGPGPEIGGGAIGGGATVPTHSPGPGPGIGGALAPGVYESTAWRQAVMLARMGLFDGARRSLEAMQPDLADVDWLVALLADRLGEVTRSVQIARRDRPEHADWYPHGTHRIRWEIAYPRPFSDIVRARAAEAGIEPALAWAIMREESGFHARIESWANALGLMQLLEPTARWLARDDGGPSDRETLMAPERNIELGTRMLGSLQSRLEHPALAIAAYNAGEASVQRWLREYGQLPLDELVESIPYRQTRRYTQRVLASLATYRALYGPEPMVVPLELPPTSRVADR